jgi:hypothetical protein
MLLNEIAWDEFNSKIRIKNHSLQITMIFLIQTFIFQPFKCLFFIILIFINVIK